MYFLSKFLIYSAKIEGKLSKTNHSQSFLAPFFISDPTMAESEKDYSTNSNNNNINNVVEIVAKNQQN